MKELNEMELRGVDGGLPIEMFFKIGPVLWIAISAVEFIAGFEAGWTESKR